MMRDMNDSFFRHIAEAEMNKIAIWMATVVTAEGSTPVKTGMICGGYQEILTASQKVQRSGTGILPVTITH
jgi:hypothetical protein